jgi:hypothetical protein
MSERVIKVEQSGPEANYTPEIGLAAILFYYFWKWELKAVVWTLLKIYAGKDVAF